MRNIEKVLVTAAVFSIILQLLHVPTGDLLLITFMTALSLLYLIGGYALFKTQENGHQQNDPLLSLLFGGAGSLLFMGILFKLMIWKHASSILALGFALMSLLFVYALFMFRRRKMSKYYLPMIWRGAALALTGGILLIVSTSVLIKLYYRNDPSYAEKFIKHLDNPDDEVLRNDWLEAKRNKFQR